MSCLNMRDRPGGIAISKGEKTKKHVYLYCELCNPSASMRGFKNIGSVTQLTCLLQSTCYSFQLLKWSFCPLFVLHENQVAPINESCAVKKVEDSIKRSWWGDYQITGLAMHIDYIKKSFGEWMEKSLISSSFFICGSKYVNDVFIRQPKHSASVSFSWKRKWKCNFTAKSSQANTEPIPINWTEQWRCFQLLCMSWNDQA